MKRISENDLDKTFLEEWIITPAKYEQLKDCKCEKLEAENGRLREDIEQAIHVLEMPRSKAEHKATDVSVALTWLKRGLGSPPADAGKEKEGE
jgi:hypothetical protein